MALYVGKLLNFGGEAEEGAGGDGAPFELIASAEGEGRLRAYGYGCELQAGLARGLIDGFFGGPQPEQPERWDVIGAFKPASDALELPQAVCPFYVDPYSDIRVKADGHDGMSGSVADGDRHILTPFGVWRPVRVMAQSTPERVMNKSLYSPALGGAPRAIESANIQFHARHLSPLTRLMMSASTAARVGPMESAETGRRSTTSAPLMTLCRRRATNCRGVRVPAGVESIVRS